MLKSDKKLNELAKTLINPDKSLVASKIEMLRNEESFEGAIELLANHYENCNEMDIKVLIAGFFNDLKNPEAKPAVINAIRSSKKDETRLMLITSCWQSGMNYSENVDDFTEFFLENSYDIGFECLTVIEQCVEDIDLKKKKEIIGLLKGKKASQPADKEPLLNELVNVLS